MKPEKTSLPYFGVKLSCALYLHLPHYDPEYAAREAKINTLPAGEADRECKKHTLPACF